MEENETEQAMQMPTPDPALERLNFLVGEWKIEGETVGGPMGPGTRIESQETFEWLEGGFFLVHRWNGVFDMAGNVIPDVGYEFIGYDAANKQYRTHFFNNFGPYEGASSMYEGDFVDGELVIIGPARITRKQNSDGTIRMDSDVLGQDGTTWEPFIKSTMTRVK